MQIRPSICFNTGVIVLMLLVSTPYLFAQTAEKVFKYVPEVVGKTKGIPYVINPNLSPAARQGAAAFSGAAVDRAVVAATQGAAVSTSAAPLKGSAQPVAGKKTPSARVLEVPSLRVLETPSFKLPERLEDIDEEVQHAVMNLTGMEILQLCFPAWRQELGGMFSKEQLDAVERAMAATDEWLFVRDEDGELQIRNPEEWNYEARFLTILQNSGIGFTERQIKQLTGGTGIKGFTLGRYFMIENLYGFIKAHDGQSPRQSIKGPDGKHPRLAELRDRAQQGDEQAAELAAELEVGLDLNNALSPKGWSKDLPERKILQALYNASRNTQTHAQFIAVYRKYLAEHDNQSPREGIRGPDGKFLRLSDLRKRAKAGNVYAAELAAELEVGTALHNALTNWSEDLPERKIVQELYDASRNTQTPTQFVAVYQKYLAEHDNQSPRMTIRGPDGKIFKLSELRDRARQGDEEAARLAAELEVGQGLQHALTKWSKDSPEYQIVKALYEESRNYAASRSTDQLYQDLVAHIRDYRHYPMARESSLYGIIYHRLHYYQSTMVDGKYVDPYLQKIYELKLWSDRVKRGEVDWTQFPDLFKKHRRTIGEMRREGQQPSPEAAQELKTLSPEEQQAIEEMADNMLTLWENFEEEWWQENQKNIVMTPNTRVAFDTVLNAVRHQVPGANNVNISNVLEQVNGMQLGQDGPEYYRVIYRGENPRLPRAEDFHNVEEIPGVPQRFAEPAYKLDKPHIFLDGDEDSVLNMFLNPGVTDREMSTVINAMTPAGWEVRIGAHELLRDIKKGKVHIHIEKIVPTTEEGARDISYVLNVNLRQLTQDQNPQQVAKTLRSLFSSYLTEEGQWALNNIQRAF